jgi:pyruvate ferredoxin oxidoreductase alpha subunit
MVGPEAFEEVRYLAYVRQLEALDLIPAVAADFARGFGRSSGGLVRSYRTEDADTVVVALGSVLGTIKDAVDARRDAGERVGVVGITTFRPFPVQAVANALAGAQRVVVVEKAFSVGFGGVLSTDVALATQRSESSLYTVVAGLGGRPITRRHLETMLAAAGEDQLEVLTFLDLDTGVVEREQARMAAATTRPGPTAEFVLRDLALRQNGEVEP